MIKVLLCSDFDLFIVEMVMLSFWSGLVNVGSFVVSIMVVVFLSDGFEVVGRLSLKCEIVFFMVSVE